MSTYDFERLDGSVNNEEDVELSLVEPSLEIEEAEEADEVEVVKEEIVVAKNIHKTYLLGIEGIPALRGVSLTIFRGEFIVILGKSGGGKTSLLNVIGTIDKPTKGEIHIGGKRISSNTTDAEFAHLRLHEIGFVFQTFNLIATMTAEENVALPMVLAGNLSKEEIKERARMLLDEVGIGARSTHYPSQLSGGEQQRVTIARAICNKPALLLLDEPTGDLDTKNSHIIMKLLLKLNRRHNITCVMVTHDQALRHYAHRVFHMMDGKLIRIEKILEEKREEMDKDLDVLIEKDRMDRKSMIEDKPITDEMRDPSFYPFLQST